MNKKVNKYLCKIDKMIVFFILMGVFALSALMLSSCSEDKGALASSNILSIDIPGGSQLIVKDVRARGFTLEWEALNGKNLEYAVAANYNGLNESYEDALQNGNIILDFTNSEILGNTYRATKLSPGRDYTITLFVRSKNTRALEYVNAKATLPYLDEACFLDVWIDGDTPLYNSEYDRYSAVYMPGAEEKTYKFTYKLDRQCQIYIDGVKYEGSEFNLKNDEYVDFTVINERSLSARDYTFSVDVIDNGIPVMIINTENNRRILNKTTRLDAEMTLTDSRKKPGGIQGYAGSITIRGRGNSSFGMPKKSYNIDFTNKTALFDLAPSREYALIASYADKSLMRNYTAYELSRDMGAAFSPKIRFVDLVVNGEYMGTYSLCERIKIDKGRLNLPKIKANDTIASILTGSYVLEVNSTDKYDTSEIIFETNKIKWSKDHFFSIKQPGKTNLSDAAYEYIKQYVNDTENALFSDNFKDPVDGFRKYIDEDSVIDWYIVNELYKQVDANFYTSVYMYKPRGDKLYFGPVWDFDLGGGNADYSGCDDPEGWYVRNCDWLERMFEDETFNRNFEKRWNYVRETYIEALFTRIDETAKYLAESQLMNFSKWQILGKYVWPNAGNVSERNTYQKEIDYLKDWLKKRVDWIDSQVNK